MALALAEERVLVTTDTDVGTILALLRGVGDSVGRSCRRDLEVIPRVEGELSEGAVIVVEKDRYRVRSLPIDEA